MQQIGVKDWWHFHNLSCIFLTMQEVKKYAIYIFLYWTDIKFSTLYTSDRFDKTSVQKKREIS